MKQVTKTPLSGIISSEMNRDVRGGEVFIFINRRQTIMKILHMEYASLVIYHKKLESGCFKLPALYYRLREIVLATDYIQVDESSVPVVNNEKHRTVKSYLWVVRSVMKNIVFFHYDKGLPSTNTKLPELLILISYN